MKCQTPRVTELQIKETFIKTVNNLIQNKNAVIDDREKSILELTNMKLIEERKIKLHGERAIAYNLLKELIE